MPRRPVARTPLQRALYPVLGGLLFFGLLGLATWGVAALLSGNPEDLSDDLSAPTFEVGDVESISSIIADDGPLIFPDLVRAGGRRTVVLDHTGDDPRSNWVVYYAAPADRSLDCKVTQVQGTRSFTDCEGRTIDVTDLMPPPGVNTAVEGRTIVIDLRNAATDTVPGTVPGTVPDATVDATGVPTT